MTISLLQYFRRGASLLGIILVSLLFSSCVTTQPMTQNTQRYLDNAREEFKSRGDAKYKKFNAKNFQYFVSRNIFLTKKGERTLKGNVSSSGTISFEEGDSESLLQVKPGQMGVLLRVEKGRNGHPVYCIAFFPDNDNVIKFSQVEQGGNKNMYLYYDDPKNKLIVFGDEWYRVTQITPNDDNVKRKASWDGIWASSKAKFKGVTLDEMEAPYLLVKMPRTKKNKTTYRSSKGRKVNVQDYD